MKSIVIKAMVLSAVVVSMWACSPVRVYSDYDKKATFTTYKTFAFYKQGLDKVQVSDLDKRRIMQSIEKYMTAKGFALSDKPDVWVNFFTKEQERTQVTQMGWGYGWGWGWSPWMWGGTNVSSYPEGTLYIDIIDATKNELVWQGQGVGALTRDPEQKDELFDTFVSKILAEYPPDVKAQAAPEKASSYP